MKRYAPKLEAYSWSEGTDLLELDGYAVMAEAPDGAYVERREAIAEIDRLRGVLELAAQRDRDLCSALDESQLCVGQLTAALQDVLSTAKASTKAAVAAMQRAKLALEHPEPGAPILTIDCPRCGAELEIEHGDEPGEIRCHRHAGGWW